MSEQIYELAFYGKLVAGSDLQQTKEQIALLFKTTIDQVERMFTGNRVVIRNKLDEDTAGKYLLALRKRGADCQIERMGQPGVAVTFSAREQASAADSGATPSASAIPAAETPPAAPAPEKAAAQAGTRKAVMSLNGLPVAGERVDDILSSTHFDLAPVGSRMEDEKPEVKAEFHELDNVSLAPPGSVLVEKKEKPPVSVPDTSHLQLEPNK